MKYLLTANFKEPCGTPFYSHSKV